MRSTHRRPCSCRFDLYSANSYDFQDGGQGSGGVRQVLLVDELERYGPGRRLWGFTPRTADGVSTV